MVLAILAMFREEEDVPPEHTILHKEEKTNG